MGKKNENKVTAEKFVEVWQKAETFDDVVKKTTLTAMAARGRANNYRRMGVNLKKFPRTGRPRLDLAALKKIVSESK